MNQLRQIKSSLTAALADLERRNFTLAVLLSAVRAFNRDHCTHLAAALAYYAFFSLFPLLLGLIALATIVLQSPDVQSRIIAAASQLLPGSSDLVQQNIQQILRTRGTVGVAAAIALLWSAKAIFGAITTSLNLIWGLPEKRPFWELTALQMALVFGAGFFLASSLALTAMLTFISTAPLPAVGWRLENTPFWTLVAAAPSLTLSAAAFLLLYRFLPSARFGFGDVWRGALVAGVLFEIAKGGYVLYTTQFANFPLVYGSLAAVIAFMLWAWISGAILLFGAEIAAEYTRLRKLRQEVAQADK